MVGGGKPIPECTHAEIRSFLIFGSLIATFLLAATSWSHGSAPYYWNWCGRLFCIAWLFALWRGASREFRLRTLAGTPPGQPRIQTGSPGKKNHLRDWSCKKVAVTMVILFLYGVITAALACALIHSSGANSGSSLVGIVFLVCLSSIGFGFFYLLAVELQKRAR